MLNTSVNVKTTLALKSSYPKKPGNDVLHEDIGQKMKLENRLRAAAI